jgi:hypothetical protein
MSVHFETHSQGNPVRRIAFGCAEILSTGCYQSLPELLGLCAKCDIHRGAHGSKWIIGFLNPMILSSGGFNVWIRITRNIIGYLFGCLVSTTGISAECS